jgi:hypothetical protein
MIYRMKEEEPLNPNPVNLVNPVNVVFKVVLTITEFRQFHE